MILKNGQILRIVNLDHDVDTAVYQCNASNPFGFVFGNAFVNVRGNSTGIIVIFHCFKLYSDLKLPILFVQILLIFYLPQLFDYRIYSYEIIHRLTFCHYQLKGFEHERLNP